MRNERKAKEAFTNEILTKGTGYAINGGTLELFGEYGVKADTKIHKVYVKSLDLRFLQQASCELLINRYKATMTETPESPIYHEIFYSLPIDTPIDFIGECIFKRLSAIVKIEKDFIIFKTVKFFDLNAYGKRFASWANKNGIEYTIYATDTIKGTSKAVDMSACILDDSMVQHVLADSRNAYRTWKETLYTA